MVCERCKMIVRIEFEKIGLYCTSVELGAVEILDFISDKQLQMIKVAMQKCGLELIDNKRSILIQKIKNVVIEMVHYSDCDLKINFSNYLSSELNLNYTYLANIFSETEGITIEHYMILHKIKRVKELIGNDELNLTEISWKLNYSSVAHLSNQFKKITGITPSAFKHLN